MSFERHRSQVYCESIIGCTTIDEWSQKRSDWESHVLDASEAAKLRSFLIADACAMLYKGTLSISEAIFGLSKYQFSWSTVKLYYGMFYLLRCSMAMRGYSIIMNRGHYLIHAAPNEKPRKLTGDFYRSTHDCVIQSYIDLYHAQDELLTNTIDDQKPYLWMKDRREQVNYRERQFHDPNYPDFMETIFGFVEQKTISHWVKKYAFGDVLYCFLDDHAVLALPIRLLVRTRSEMKSLLPAENNPDKQNLLRGLLTVNPPIEADVISSLVA